jgi:hypothetical protein
MLLIIQIFVFVLNGVLGGMNTESVKIQASIGNYSGFKLQACKKIAKGEIVVEIPWEFCLWTDRSGRVSGLRGQSELTEMAGDLRQPVDDTEYSLGRTWDAQMALALLEATAGAGLKNEWWDNTYTWLLPKPEDVAKSIPFCMSHNDLAEMPPHIRDAALAQKERLRNLLCRARNGDGYGSDTDALVNHRTSHRVLKLAAERLGGSLEHLQLTPIEWAFACVRSRVFNSDPSRAKRQEKSWELERDDDWFVMVPIIDSCNHSFSPNCEFESDKKEKTFRLRALRDIVDAEECTISYGDLDNTRLLRQYGFTLLDNPFGDGDY